MRVCYTLVFYLLTPLIFLRLYWRGIKAPDYRRRWLERLAIYPAAHTRPVIWFHAVSVGEAEALFPLIKLFQQSRPDLPILITTTTPTGSARVKSVLGDAVQHVYLPYDLPDAIQRFLKHFNPLLAVIMETEIWPNLFNQCGKQSIPLFIINARLSEKSAKGYAKVPALLKPTIANVTLIAAQARQDYERFIIVGAQPKQVKTVGNIKFDLDIAVDLIDAGKALRVQLFPGRLVWIIASSHKNEEIIFLQIYQQIKVKYPGLLLLIVPRHPERFTEVKALCEKFNLQVVMRSSKQGCIPTTDVYLADTMGELKMLYAAADVAFVGGSLVNIGGHNVLEPAAIGVPVMFGPYMANFKAIETGLLNAGGALRCADAKQTQMIIQQLLEDPEYRHKIAANAEKFVHQNRGILKKLYTILNAHVQRSAIPKQ